ncbi:DUF4363 family protein [Anaeromicropila populeti]|uniref:DUF4363 domain-containing protein n=1 Tax=Anaeromicropila populeti TaxID=37658 RepID=A0A1I6KAP2_9FIRM|nr:DUF4363 family protein [Anaeromicropila populeti]SFR88279.1 protein of unknown function [Anaeromicropila populeti]
MSNKSLTLSLSAFILVLLALFFFLQNYVFDRDNRIEGMLSTLNNAIQQKDWTAAEKTYDDFNKIWSKGKYLIEINNADQDFSEMNTAVKELKSAIEIKSQADALISLTKISGDWTNFKKLVPEP